MTGEMNYRARHRVLALVVLAGAVATLAGWGVVALGAASPGRPAVAPTSSSQQVAMGRTLYQERCSTCHGPEAAGTVQGPPIVGLGPAYDDFMMSTGRMPTQASFDCPGCSAAQFSARIQTPRRRPILSPTQIRAVTVYLTSLSPVTGEPIPAVDPKAGHLPEGATLYQRNCSPCHGWSGIGGAVGPQDAPGLYQATPRQIAEAVRIGPGTMPRFGQAVLDRAQLDSLARYVLFLRDPVDRGGASLSHVGPLIEGFVGLGIGLGLIIVTTRYIGTRS
jgi:ubiquinol-cytochrome c reductase cytochrome c subunit